MKFCPVDRCVNPDDAARCRNCGHVFKKARREPPAPTLSELPGSRPAPAKTRSRAVLGPEETVRRVGSPARTVPALQRLDAEGRPGETFLLNAEPLVLGRTEGLLTVPDDPLLSPAHASIRCDGVQAFLRDLRSRRGTFVRAEKVDLFDGLECLVGETLLRWAPAPSGEGWRVAVSCGDAPPRTADLGSAFSIGRADQDLALDDPTVSPVHAKARRTPQGTSLVDARSLNGIYYRIPPNRNEVLEAGGQFRAGGQLFRFDVPGR